MKSALSLMLSVGLLAPGTSGPIGWAITREAVRLSVVLSTQQPGQGPVGVSLEREAARLVSTLVARGR